MVIVVLTVLLIATPGLAAGGGGKNSTSFNLYGTIDDLSCDIPGYIEVAKSWPGTGSVTVVTDLNTLYKACTGIPGEGNDISCDQLVDGSEVRIIGDRVDGTLIATRVIQY